MQHCDARSLKDRAQHTPIGIWGLGFSVLGFATTPACPRLSIARCDAHVHSRSQCCVVFVSQCGFGGPISYDLNLRGSRLWVAFCRVFGGEIISATMLARLLRMPVVANAAQRTRTGLADFFEAGRDPNQDANITYGTVLILDTGMAHFRVFYDIAECEDNDSTAAFVLQKF
jgi:hypothetical protein